MEKITRQNIDQLLDAGKIEVNMGTNWWTIRRNGKTQKWKRDTYRIRIPVKAGFRDTFAIDDSDFLTDETLRSDQFRIKKS